MNICGRCGEEVFFAEQKLAIGKVWHSFCFSCCKCGKLLDSCSVCPYNAELYCPGCYRGVSSTPNLPSCMRSKPRRCSNPSVPFKPHHQAARNYRETNYNRQNCYENHTRCNKNCVCCDCDRCNCDCCIRGSHLGLHEEKGRGRVEEIEELECTCGKCKQKFEESKRCYCGVCSRFFSPEPVVRHFPRLYGFGGYNKQKFVGRKYKKSPEVQANLSNNNCCCCQCEGCKHCC